MDIKTILMKELLTDKEDCIVDIKVCQKALALGTTQYSGGSIQNRLDVNKEIIIKIDKEIARRI